MVSTAQQLVKAMEGALVLILAHATALLQQVCVNGGANDHAGIVKVNANEFALRMVGVRAGKKAKITGRREENTTAAE